ncbi:phosphatase PAP2 family protein [Fructobacillus ficulneus]|uniref:PAP2 family protein n=1 Tax=Fructobacillus ficulneus TaxID=157463 RepID=A0A0K8MK46_9LACO|nr:phosphatase PAP2 family protein [Fructobacillus ficulneus]GAP00544.1 PAP2 family protein [Fructobacillus ficulneus]
MKTKKLTYSYYLLILFLFLTANVVFHTAALKIVDKGAHHFVKHLHSHDLTSFFKVIAHLGSPAVAIGLSVVLALYLFFIRRQTFSAIYLAGIQLSGSAIAEIVKLLVRRPRPTYKLVPDTGYSFPSGHTFTTAILVFSLLFLLSNQATTSRRIIAYVLAWTWIFLVAFSRVYLGDHFTSDVLASVLLASAYWLLMTAMQNKLLDYYLRFIPNHGLISQEAPHD